MTLPLRRVVFWAHLCAGVLAGVVVLLMSVTGVLLAYEKQMVRWADGFHAPPLAPGQSRLPLEDLVSRARAARPGARPGTVVVRRDPAAPVEIGYGRDGSLFVNAYTGEVLGSGSARARAFFRSVTEWHRWVAMKDQRRAVGKQITGISNLVFLFIVVSGFYLWWPRTWRWAQFRQVLWFRGGLRGKARDFNWHHVIGYWSLAPLLVIVWSGVVIGYPWASDLTYRLAGEAPPRPPAQGARTEAGPGRTARADMATRSAADAARVPAAERSDDDTAAMGAYQPMGVLMALAQRRAGDWTILSARLPTPGEATLQVTIDTGTGAQPQKKSTLLVDRRTGAETKWEPFEAQSRGRQWRTWLRFAHTGEYYGVAGQTVAMIVTAGSVVLVWTGLALTWRRWCAWKARGASQTSRAA
jgi:uncharacterized iron-regulated membrane protein